MGAVVKPGTLCAAVLLSTLAGVAVGAERTGPCAAAAIHYDHALDLARQGLFAGALDEFNAAYATCPNFAVLYDIGQTQDRLGRPLEAIAALTRYLREGADHVPLSRREQAQAQIALLEAKLAELSVATDRPGAVVRVDGREVGVAPLFQPERLAAGAHSVSATAPDGARLTRQVTLAEGERRNLELSFGPPALATPPVAPAVPTLVTAPPPATEPAGWTLRRAPAILAGGGVVLGGAALGVYLANRGQYQDWQAQNQNLVPGTMNYHQLALANNQLADDLTTADHAILGLSLAAGALVAAGVTMFLVNRAHGRPGWSALW